MHIRPLVLPEHILQIRHQSLRDMMYEAHFNKDLFMDLPNFRLLKSLFMQCITGHVAEQFTFFVAHIGGDRYIVRLTLRSTEHIRGAHGEMNHDDPEYDRTVRENERFTQDIRRHLTKCGFEGFVRAYRDIEKVYFVLRWQRQTRWNQVELTHSRA